MRRLATVLLAAALLAGCVHAPERGTPDIDVPPPEHWSADDDPAIAEVGGEWWTDLGDPALPDLILAGLEHNRNLRAAAARLDRAEAEARIAGADLKPEFGVGLSAARSKQNFVGFPIPGSESSVLSARSSRYGVSLDASWEIDLWGRLRAGARAALANYQATEADLRGARLSLAAQIAKVWFAVVEARQQVSLASDTVVSRSESMEQVRARYESGIRSPLDLRLALSNLANAESALEFRRRQLDRAARQLQVLTGRYPDLSVLDAHRGDSFPANPRDVPVGLPAELVARRPDIDAAERRLASADQRLLVARRNRYPRLVLTGSGGTVSADLVDLLDGNFGVWSLAASLAQPLFQGGKLRAGVDRADAETREALELYAGTVLEAYAEVETALAAEKYLAGQERHLAESDRQLSAALRLAEDRYHRGVGFYLVVLDSQSRAFLARSELLALRRQRMDNRIDLYLALGGGFDGDSPAPPPLAVVERSP